MHNLFKIRGQKKKKDDVEGQISARILKHVKMKTLFFAVMHTNYMKNYFLSTYKLSNKQINKLSAPRDRSGMHG